MPKYINVAKQLVRLYRLNLDCEDVIREFLVTAEPEEVVKVKNGKWTEKEVIYKEEAKDIIEEWQTCNCSVCGRYDTRPYMYYFDEPRFCSWCGADMREEMSE